MLRLPDAWVWDSWLVDDGSTYHLFFLYASRALKDPEARHRRASVGHAVSDDLTRWERVADALVRSDAPAFDDLAIWTGSVVRHPDGPWRMFYTGATVDPVTELVVQTIGCATSPDLTTWTKDPGPVLRADPRWYELAEDGHWHDEAFRDPWVVADPGGEGWHMLITARSADGPPGAPDDTVDRGVVGHAWSPDLVSWELRPPLTGPGQGFGELEVFQLARVAGRDVLVFNGRRVANPAGAQLRSAPDPGVWVTAAPSVTGPFDIAGAQQLTDGSLYVGKFIDDRDTGEARFLAFRNVVDGEFVGEITDPMRASWAGDRLVLSTLDGEPAVPDVG